MLRLGAFLVRADRGGYKLLNIAQRRGWLDKVVRYQISPNVTIDVPVFRPENRWTAGHVNAYERELVEDLTAAARAAAGAPVLVDCGADIGTISVLVTARSSRVGRGPRDRARPRLARLPGAQHATPPRRRVGTARSVLRTSADAAGSAAPTTTRIATRSTSRPTRMATSPS